MIHYQFNKLIRSKLPERMTNEGVKLHITHLSKAEYIKELKNKIVEEASEVAETKTKENLVTELADVMEVIRALSEANDITLEEIEAARVEKRSVNGCFLPENYIHYIEVAPDNHEVIEYMENKERPYKKLTV
ncbi:MAG: phosphoribosyl-ATP pyrophosphohydrolase [Rickettsiales bacterium]|nr:MAG: phosphoribosyl-ATP pyrophosphohydrolase [Rickettsiales bacterium]